MHVQRSTSQTPAKASYNARHWNQPEPEEIPPPLARAHTAPVRSSCSLSLAGELNILILVCAIKVWLMFNAAFLCCNSCGLERNSGTLMPYAYALSTLLTSYSLSYSLSGLTQLAFIVKYNQNRRICPKCNIQISGANCNFWLWLKCVHVNV